MGAEAKGKGGPDDSGGFHDTPEQMLTPENIETKYSGLMPSPEAHRSQFNNESQAERLIKKAQAEHPDKNVRFMSAREYAEQTGIGRDDLNSMTNGEPSKYGVVAIEKQADPTKLSSEQLRAMKLDTKKYANSPGRIDIGGEAFDAKRITKAMLKGTDQGPSYPVRAARAFMEGIAALQTEKGVELKIPDSMVIARIGDEDLTFGKAKKLDVRTGTDKLDDADTNALVESRKAYKAAGPEDRQEIAKSAKKIVDAKAERIAKEQTAEHASEEPGTSPSKDAQIHEAASQLAPKDLEATTNLDGSNKNLPVTRTNAEALKGVVDEMAASHVAAQRVIADKAKQLLDAKLSKEDAMRLQTIVALKKPSERAAVINKLAEKYGVQADAKKVAEAVAAREAKQRITPVEPEAPKAPEPPPPVKNPQDLFIRARDLVDRSLDESRRFIELQDNTDQAAVQSHADEAVALGDAYMEMRDRMTDKQQRAVESMLQQFGRAFTNTFNRHYADPVGAEQVRTPIKIKASGEPPSPKVRAAKQAAFLEKARSGDPELIKTLASSDDAKGLQRAAEALSKEDIRDSRIAKTVDAINKRLGELVQNPDTAYGLQTKKYSLEHTDKSASASTATQTDIAKHIETVLGPKVQVRFAKMLNAGDFVRTATHDVIRLSVHALDPTSVAYHESLHGFFAQLRDMGNHETTRTLVKAAESPAVMNQLRKLLANEPEALRQLTNPEERAAYMYQFWAAKKLSLGDGVQGLFKRIASGIRSALGIWSNDERALHILRYFNEGEFAKGSHDVNAVTRALNEPGKNKAFEALKKMAEPVTKIGDSVFGAGQARLRDTGVPALSQLADLVKRTTTGEGQDQGFLPAAREHRTATMNGLGEALHGYTKDQIHEGLEALQTKQPAASTEGKTVARIVRKVLDDQFKYMTEAGVNVKDLGVGKDYFPRVYDPDYISRHQTEFQTLLEKHGVANPVGVMHAIVGAEGNEFRVTSRPGMQNLKERVLKNIPDDEIARFVQKDLFQTMNSYITQAGRRAEWARRFGDDGSRLKALYGQAVKEGATADQITAAEKYMQGVDGTLGDDLNPTARRLMGNMIVYQNVRLLPLAIFSSAVDPLGIIVRGGTVGDAWKTFKRGIAEIPKGLKGSDAKDASTRLAETMGVIDNASLVHSLGAMYSQGMVSDTGRKINDTFFRLNLMEQFNTSMRVGATEAALNFLQRHVTAPNEHSARYLSELGLKASDVTMRDGRVALTEADGLTAEHALQMRAAVNKWVDGAILRPDAADKPVWMNDPHFALVSHLKQFVYSFHHTMLARVAHEMRNGNYTPAYALLSYVPVMIAADALKGALQGGGSQPQWKQDWGPEDYLWSGIQRGGLLGVGQFGADVINDVHRGGIGIGALAGPSLEQLGDAVEAIGGHKQFSNFALHAMPANALYAESVGHGQADPNFAE